MKNKILIGAGILLAVFIVFLVAICGASTGTGTLDEEELKENISCITCENDSGTDIDYDISILTNDVQFDDEILTRCYTKFITHNDADFATLGVAFVIKSNSDTTFTFNLMKNDEVLKTCTLSASSDTIEIVDLTLSESAEILTTDEFYITVSQDEISTYLFDTMIFYFDEV